MGIFKFKYLTSIIGYSFYSGQFAFCFLKPQIKKAETSMLITEVIKIQDTSVLNTVNDFQVKKNKNVLQTKITKKKYPCRRLF